MPSTKQQEIQSREAQLLEVAARILIAEGYAALSMERLAAELNTAKGTIYNHFPNLEEVLLAIAVKAIDKRQSMFDRASLCRRPSRERLLAVGIACEIYVMHYPQFFLVENLVRHAAIWERCAEAKRDFMLKQDHRCMGLVSGIIRSAIAAGDLTLEPAANPEEVTLTLWGLTYGSYLINATSPSLKELGVRSVDRAVRIGAVKVLDGFGWQPIWSHEEHARIFADICETVFSDEPAIPSFEELFNQPF